MPSRDWLFSVKTNMAANLPGSMLTDLFGHLSVDSRQDVKFFALKYVLGLTGTKEGTKFIEEHPKLLERVAELTHDVSADVQKESYMFLVNASASPVVADKLQELELYEEILRRLLDKSCMFADNLAMILSNLTRMEHGHGAEKWLQNIETSKECSLEQLLEALCAADKYNEHADLDYLAPFLSNMSRLRKVRMICLDEKSGLIQRLLSYVSHRGSTVRRKGVVGILRNCCFEYDCHEWLLGNDVDILPSLLLPLAGPEEFSETETDKLPLGLQYLEESKQRESDPEIRKMLLETITLLCAKAFGRQYIKEKNTYFIIRELHKWETDENVTSCIEKLVQILIGDEPPAEMANLHEVEIPTDLREEFEQCDQKKSN